MLESSDLDHKEPKVINFDVDRCDTIYGDFKCVKNRLAAALVQHITQTNPTVEENTALNSQVQHVAGGTTLIG